MFEGSRRRRISGAGLETLKTFWQTFGFPGKVQPLTRRDQSPDLPLAGSIA
jgi:hypothetical protein